MSQTFYVVVDGMGKPFASFEDLLPAILDMEERVRENSDDNYYKVEAVWAESPEAAADEFDDGYLRVFDSNTREPAWFPDLDPGKKTYYVVFEGEMNGIFGAFTELTEALDLWYYWYLGNNYPYPEDLFLSAVYAAKTPVEILDPYLKIWDAKRYRPDIGWSKDFDPERRLALRMQRGGFPGPKDWTPTGKLTKPGS